MTPYGDIDLWVNIGSCNSLMPDGTKPLPEPSVKKKKREMITVLNTAKCWYMRWLGWYMCFGIEQLYRYTRKKKQAERKWGFQCSRDISVYRSTAHEYRAFWKIGLCNVICMQCLIWLSPHQQNMQWNQKGCSIPMPAVSLGFTISKH